MDLAALLLEAVEARRALIDATGRRWPDRPVQIEFNWHPRMAKVDVVVRTVDHLPPWHPPKVVDP